MRPLLLRGGRVVDPSQQRDDVSNVLLVDGTVAAVGRDVHAPDDAQVIDCAGQIVSPGFVDVHCHLREPGREDVETVRIFPVLDVDQEQRVPPQTPVMLMSLTTIRDVVLFNSVSSGQVCLSKP